MLLHTQLIVTFYTIVTQLFMGQICEELDQTLQFVVLYIPFPTALQQFVIVVIEQYAGNL